MKICLSTAILKNISISVILDLLLSLVNFVNSVDEIFVKIATFLNFAILENESNTDNKMKHGRFGKIFVTFYPKSKGNVSERDLSSSTDTGLCRDDKKPMKFEVFQGFLLHTWKIQSHLTHNSLHTISCNLLSLFHTLIDSISDCFFEF